MKKTLNESEAEGLKRNKKKRPGNVLLEVDLPFLAMLRAAADGRGMTSAAYSRRAVAAFVSKDLGIPFSEVTQHFAKPVGHGEVLGKRNREGRHAKSGKTVDDGTGYGQWEVM